MLLADARMPARGDGTDVVLSNDQDRSLWDPSLIARLRRSTWNLFGRAVSGPLRGQRLDPVEHLDTFWFAWVAFQPDTDLVAGP